jgi:homoserine dehydrogenase
MQTHEGGYYIRLSVHDRPGAIAAIATRMAEQRISLESVVQLRAGPARLTTRTGGDPNPVVMITHRTREDSSERTDLEKMATFKVCRK